MTSWSADWEPAARTALVALRGEGTTDARGLPIPALSVTDAISTLAAMIPGIVSELSRVCQGPAVTVDYVTVNGFLDGAGLLDVDTGSTLPIKEYLAGYPSPPDPWDSARAIPRPWARSPTDYSRYTQEDPSDRDYTLAVGSRAFATAMGDGTRGAAAVYTIYTRNPYDATGQITECRQLVSEYQAACDAIASGAATQADMAQPMSAAALQAFWRALLQIGASLDTLSDVPPRPPTAEVLQSALNDAAETIGDTLAKVANVSGEVIGNAAKGVLEGIGLPGLAVAVGVIAIAIALR